MARKKPDSDPPTETNSDATDQVAPAPKRRRRTIVHSASSVPALPKEMPGSLDIRKPVESIMVRNRRSSTISLLERKAVNNLLGFAQKMHREGGATPSDIYRIPIRDFEQMLSVKVNNRTHLLKVLDSISDMKVEFDSEKRPATVKKGDHELIPRGTENLVGVANIIAEIYLDTATKEIVFSLPAKARDTLLRPEHFNRLQNMVLNEFTTHAAMVLYEFVSAYFTSPGKRTPKRPWENLSVALSGASEPHATYREFSKMLTRAVEQVNSVIADDGYHVTVHSTLVGKKTGEIWFEIETLQQKSLGLGGSPRTVSAEVQDKLKDLGLKPEIIEELVIRFGEDYLLAQHDYVLKRIKNTKLPEVGSPKALFLAALEKNFADAPRESVPDKEKPAEKQQPPEKTKAEAVQSIRELWFKHQRDALKARYDGLPDEEKAHLVASLEQQLKRSSSHAWDSYKKKGWNLPLVKTHILQILADQEIKEPSPEQLLEFAMTSGMLNLAATQAPA